MAAYGSAEWLAALEELAVDLPETPGVTVRAELAVSGTPEGDVAYQLDVSNGQVMSTAAGPAADGTVDVSIAMTYSLASSILGGSEDANAAYMRGDLKPTGHTGRLLDLLAWSQTGPVRKLGVEPAARTDA
jgi:hypothetical protein